MHLVTGQRARLVKGTRVDLAGKGDAPRLGTEDFVYGHEMSERIGDS